MLLQEFFNLEKSPIEDTAYSPENDSRVVDVSDTRKTRLCLWDIHKARVWSDNSQEAREDELENIRQIYKAPEAGTL